ncbi:MAG: hypothetical protein M3Z54_01610 [Gemmatimonadota bacterium]|nr:hypothetical protein [Gemmatimonadota bacterium]
MVSAGLWSSGSIDVVGFPWCKDAPKKVGLGSLTAKILCRTHNNALSPVDSAASAAFETLRKVTEATSTDRKASKLPKRPARFEIPEPWLLERWFLKTALNLCVVADSKEVWRQTRLPLSQLPEKLVQIAFGLEPFVKPMGLYATAALGENVAVSEGVSFSPLIYGEEGMIGALFTFRGFRFVLHLEPLELPAVLEVPGVGVRHWPTGKLLYHHQRYNWAVGRKITRYVQLLWHLQPSA